MTQPEPEQITQGPATQDTDLTKPQQKPSGNTTGFCFSPIDTSKLASTNELKAGNDPISCE